MTYADMREVTIITAATASGRCDSGDWAETADDTTGIPALLAHGAEHAMTTGHRVHEYVNRNLTVDPL